MRALAAVMNRVREAHAQQARREQDARHLPGFKFDVGAALHHVRPILAPLVFFHVVGPMGELPLRIELPGGRDVIRSRSAVVALHLLRRLL